MAAVLPASGLVLDGAGEVEVVLAATVVSAAGALGAGVVLLGAGVTLLAAVEALSSCRLQAPSAAATASTNASLFMGCLSR